MNVFLDLARGSKVDHAALIKDHEDVKSWLIANASSYGLPEDLDALDEVGRETLIELFEGANPGKKCLLLPPEPLIVGQMTFELSNQLNLSKHTLNFQTLLTAASNPSRGINKKALSYINSPVHRYVKGFVLQGGDVTRGDGSGGESIFGSPLQDPKPPHAQHAYGSLSFASSGAKNSSTSQFFICLCGPASPNATFTSTERKDREERAKKKLDGKYFPFAKLLEGEDVLQKLEKKIEQVGVTKAEKPAIDVWVAAGGIIEE